MVGHIDLLCDPSSPQGYQAAISLTHLPGCIQHAPFSSCPIPALATSTSTYHLVGPSPFIFTPVAEPQGPLDGDSVRTSTMFFPLLFYLCHGEAPIQPGGVLATAGADCFCVPQINGPWKSQFLAAQSCCYGLGVAVQSLPVPGTPFALGGIRAFTLGQRNVTSGFADIRSLVVYVGLVQNNMTCNPVLQPLAAVTGVSTTQSFFSVTMPSIPTPGCSVSTAADRSFIDLQNMLPLAYFGSSTGIPTPGFGSLFVSDLVLSFISF
jgi:hypothetical protein